MYCTYGEFKKKRKTSSDVENSARTSYTSNMPSRRRLTNLEDLCDEFIKTKEDTTFLADSIQRSYGSLMKYVIKLKKKRDKFCDDLIKVEDGAKRSKAIATEEDVKREIFFNYYYLNMMTIREPFTITSHSYLRLKR